MAEAKVRPSGGSWETESKIVIDFVRWFVNFPETKWWLGMSTLVRRCSCPCSGSELFLNLFFFWGYPVAQFARPSVLQVSPNKRNAAANEGDERVGPPCRRALRGGPACKGVVEKEGSSSRKPGLLLFLSKTVLKSHAKLENAWKCNPI